MSERPKLTDLDSGVPDWTTYHIEVMFYMDQIEAENTRLREVVAFFAAVIRSGEVWTQQCQTALNKAMKATP